jgi:Family of unknown function (DUF5989)
MSESSQGQESFEKAAQEARGGTLFSDFFAFMRENAKWWLIPIVCVFAMLGILLALLGTGAAPFLYTLF